MGEGIGERGLAVCAVVWGLFPLHFTLGCNMGKIRLSNLGRNAVISYTCQNCGAPLEGPDSAEGTEDRCPACGATHRVPFLPIFYECPSCGTKLKVQANSPKGGMIAHDAASNVRFRKASDNWRRNADFKNRPKKNAAKQPRLHVGRPNERLTPTGRSRRGRTEAN